MLFLPARLRLVNIHIHIHILEDAVKKLTIWMTLGKINDVADGSIPPGTNFHVIGSGSQVGLPEDQAMLVLSAAFSSFSNITLRAVSVHSLIHANIAVVERQKVRMPPALSHTEPRRRSHWLLSGEGDLEALRAYATQVQVLGPRSG